MVKRFIAKTKMTKVANTVAGGGIAGLAVAAALAQQGAPVTVHERAPSLRAEGAGLQISPNGVRVLTALGLGAQLSEKSVQSQAVVPMDGLTGRPVTRFALSQDAPGFRMMHRGDLLAMLAEACDAAGVEIVTGSTLTPDTAPQTGNLLAADGLHSEFRPLLNGLGKPFFTGQVAWRAVIDGEAAPEACIWMLPGRHVVSYPLPGGKINIVAVQERSEWAEEGWSHADNPAHLMAAFDDAASPLKSLLSQVKSVNLWGLFRHDVAETWAEDDIYLLGDAAHPTLPFLAQGANLALEDAWVLSRCLTGNGDYQQLRQARVRRAIAAANANAVNYHLRGVRRSASHAVLKGIGAVAPNVFLSRLSWLYDHDVTRSAS